MDNRFLSGSIFAAFGIVVFVLVQFVLPFCPVMGGMAMRCHSSQVAETFIGFGLVVVGFLAFLVANRKTQIALAAVAFVANVSVALIPTVIVGTCPKIHMHCHSVAAPVLLLVGIAFAIISAVFFIVRLKNASVQK